MSPQLTKQLDSTEVLKFHKIAAALRRRIIREEFKPGQKLPPRVELAARLRTTPVTMQQAVDFLVNTGYLRTEPRQGTFVAHHPAHTAHFALTFPWVKVPLRSQFFQAVYDEADKLRSPACRVSVFYGIHSHVDTEDYERLLGLVKAQALAGLIFGNSPYAMGASPLLDAEGLPRVAIAAGSGALDLPTVYPNINAFMPRAMDWLATRQRRRVAVIELAANESVAAKLNRLGKMATERGLQLAPHCVQGHTLDGRQWAEQTTQLFMRGPAAERPDALIITDDNLVEPATRGLAAAGVRIPEDLDVVALVNFPQPPPAAVPVTWLGFDTCRLIQICIERLAQQRRGEIPPAHTAIPALFESEYAVQQKTQEVEV